MNGSKYHYKAIDAGGRRVAGVLEAASMPRAARQLKDEGLWVLSLVDRSQSILYREIELGGPRVKPEHFTAFCRQLATMYRAGISIVESARILSEQAPGKAFRKVLQHLAEDMKGGTQLSVAAAAYPSIFSPVFINMVRAGELTGNLDVMLERLAVFYEKERNTREKVKSAMVYPIIMLVLMVLVVTFMMIFVIPKYVESFASLGVELPLPTRIVITISEFMQAYWYVAILGLASPFLANKLIRRSEAGRQRLDRWKLRVPVFGTLWHKQAIARFSRTFSSLFGAAIPMLQGLGIVSQVLNNDAIGKLILDMREQIRSGQPMSEYLRANWLFPPMVVQMIEAGERSGALDSMLEKIADFYEADVEAMTDRLKSLLEPLMIVLLTGVVGLIVLAVLMPTFKVLEGY